MKKLRDTILVAIQRFESENPGVFVEKIDLDQYGNIGHRIDGGFERVNYRFKVELCGAPARKDENN